MNLKILGAGLVFILLSVSLGILPGFHKDTIEYYNVTYEEEVPKQITVEYPVNRTVTRIDPVYQNSTVYPNIWSSRIVRFDNSTIIIQWNSTYEAMMVALLPPDAWEEIVNQIWLEYGTVISVSILFGFVTMPIALHLFPGYLQNTTLSHTTGEEYIKFGAFSDYTVHNVTPGNYSLVVFTSSANNVMNFTIGYPYEEVVTEVHAENQTIMELVEKTRLENRTNTEYLLELPDAPVPWSYIALVLLLMGVALIIIASRK